MSSNMRACARSVLHECEVVAGCSLRFKVSCRGAWMTGCAALAVEVEAHARSDG